MIVTDKSLLTKECKDTSLFEAYNIVSRLEEELLSSQKPGIGLAANQISIDAKVCIIRTGLDKINLANPVIVEKHDLRSFKNEGCLSFPGEFIFTKRYNDILVKDLFHPNGIVCTGLTAVVVQHEISHLYGETMHDYEIKIPKSNEPCWCGSGKKFKQCHMNKSISQF